MKNQEVKNYIEERLTKDENFSKAFVILKKFTNYFNPLPIEKISLCYNWMKSKEEQRKSPVSSLDFILFYQAKVAKIELNMLPILNNIHSIRQFRAKRAICTECKEIIIQSNNVLPRGKKKLTCSSECAYQRKLSLGKIYNREKRKYDKSRRENTESNY